MSGILSSFNIGVSGLRAMGAGMSIVGDNIANASTNGFKSSRGQFQDVLATSLRGIDGGDQFGAGTKLGHITPKFTQGNIKRTESITDLALNGNGFFVVDAPFGRAYTRDGAFYFDKEGYMTNSDGYRVKGYKTDDKGEATNEVDSIRLGNVSIPATATEKVELLMNIDSREKVKEFNIEDPDNTSSYSNSVNVYDNVGTARLVTLYFNKTENNTYQYHAVVDGKDAAGGEDGKLVEMASGTVKFNDKGQLLEEIPGNNSFNFADGAAPDQKVEFSFGESITEGGTGLEASTQYGVDTVIARHTADGNSAGSLASMSFNDDGVLTAVYDNGISRNIGQVIVAKFENNEGMFKIGKNLYKESRNSGQPNLGRPGEGGRGEVLAKSVELSNVDIAEEFVDLMTFQRNFTANAKTLSTADEMLKEVLNIKR